MATGQLHRASQPSSANSEQTLSISSGSPSLNAEHYGSALKPVLCTVHFGSTTSSTDITATLNSGLGSDYDVVLKLESFSGDDWVWSFQDDLPEFRLLPWDSPGIVADALDLTVAAAGGSIISYAVIYYELLG